MKASETKEAFKNGGSHFVSTEIRLGGAGGGGAFLPHSSPSVPSNKKWALSLLFLLNAHAVCVVLCLQTRVLLLTTPSDVVVSSGVSVTPIASVALSVNHFLARGVALWDNGQGKGGRERESGEGGRGGDKQGSARGAGEKGPCIPPPSLPPPLIPFPFPLPPHPPTRGTLGNAENILNANEVPHRSPPPPALGAATHTHTHNASKHTTMLR